MRRRRRSEENAHAERWLVSYADFMTLLFALFVVLFASSYQDKRTVQRVSSAVKNGFQNVGVYLQSDGIQGSSSSDLSKVDSAASERAPESMLPSCRGNSPRRSARRSNARKSICE